MIIKIVVVTPGKQPEVTTCIDVDVPQLIGGAYEQIEGPGWAAWINVRPGQDFNFAATDLAEYLGWAYAPEVLCGAVVFTGPLDNEGIDTDVPEFVVKAALKYITVEG